MTKSHAMSLGLEGLDPEEHGSVWRYSVRKRGAPS